MAGASRLAQRRDELAAEDPRQRPDRKQEPALRRLPFPGGRQRPTGDQGVHMHMPPEVLLPRVVGGEKPRESGGEKRGSAWL